MRLYFEIGTVFTDNGKTMKVVESPKKRPCIGCVSRCIKKISYCGIVECRKDKREDGKNVIFQEVK